MKNRLKIEFTASLCGISLVDFTNDWLDRMEGKSTKESERLRKELNRIGKLIKNNHTVDDDSMSLLVVLAHHSSVDELSKRMKIDADELFTKLVEHYSKDGNSNE